MCLTYKSTIRCCFVGYIVQAVINNFAPLLFITFNSVYNIPLSEIALLISMNFGVQLATDLTCAVVIEKTGWRVPIVLCHGLSAAGLILLGILPRMTDHKFAALCIAVAVYSVGGGLLETLISPITEACPGDDKAGAMSLLHSFYCWGQMGVVAVSTLFFFIFGIENWHIMAFIWALIPIVNGIFFAFVPLGTLTDEGQEQLTVKKLFCNRTFLVMIVIMLCAASAELSVSQWASAFAEKGLGVSKAAGDLLGPMMFAFFMGMSRLIHAFFGKKLGISLEKTIFYSTLFCVLSYLIIALVPLPAVALCGMALCGFSVGLLWPGAFSIAGATIKGGGTTMFALLALFGDLGCGFGPFIVGQVADAMNNNLSAGILVTAAFPLLLAILLLPFIKAKQQ